LGLLEDALLLHSLDKPIVASLVPLFNRSDLLEGFSHVLEPLLGRNIRKPGVQRGPFHLLTSGRCFQLGQGVTLKTRGITCRNRRFAPLKVFEKGCAIGANLRDKIKPIAIKRYRSKCDGCGGEALTLTRGDLPICPGGTTNPVRDLEGSAEVSRGHSRAAGQSEGPKMQLGARSVGFDVMVTQQLHFGWGRVSNSEGETQGEERSVCQVATASERTEPPKGVTMEEVVRRENLQEGEWSKTEAGMPQGAVISPLLANIYLHYVLDLWVHRWRRKHASGDVIVVRYADDCHGIPASTRGR
jgi:hypothetical protein